LGSATSCAPSFLRGVLILERGLHAVREARSAWVAPAYPAHRLPSIPPKSKRPAEILPAGLKSLFALRFLRAACERRPTVARAEMVPLGLPLHRIGFPVSHFALFDGRPGNSFVRHLHRLNTSLIVEVLMRAAFTALPGRPLLASTPATRGKPSPDANPYGLVLARIPHAIHIIPPVGEKFKEIFFG